MKQKKSYPPQHNPWYNHNNEYENNESYDDLPNDIFGLKDFIDYHIFSSKHLHLTFSLQRVLALIVSRILSLPCICHMNIESFLCIG